ncbi:hypothetical protein [Boudabousia marimammalium]|uniref:Transporter n=1 Tax=Boudabousia marimammalium TaxID=156892 RepID=A0A1Q5PRX1_9ACTO|nr:hypothetical protein [Boudabousia marimammalium]OKL50338.1 hypothetical protein BM477_02860 [Boudabousia marimammalium]
MVGTLVKLRFKLTWNNLKRNTAQLVGAIFGYLYLVGLLVGAVAGLIAGAYAGYMSQIGQLLPIAGLGLLLLSVLGPVVLASLDESVEPKLFVNTNVPDRKFAISFILAENLSSDGLLTAVLLLLPAAGWLIAGDIPAAFVTFLIAPGAYLLVAGASRVTAVLADRIISAKRGVKTALNLILFALMMLFFIGFGYGINVVIKYGIGTLDILSTTAWVLGWTPLGAPFIAAHYASLGQWWAVTLTLLITYVTAALLIWVWIRLLPQAMSGVAENCPDWERLYAQQNSRTAHLTAARLDSSQQRFLPTTDWFRRLGASPATAGTAARSLKYWFKDPRYSMGLILPAIFILGAYLMGQVATFNLDVDEASGVATTNNWLVYYFLIFAFASTGMMTMADTAMDSTAFWHHGTSGMKGREDRLGRLLGALIWQLPYLSALLLLAVFLFDINWILLVTLSFPLLFTLQGVGLFVSARFVYPTKAPGTNGLSNSGAGASGWQALVQFVTYLVVSVLTFPGWGLYLILSYTAPAYVWVSMVTGFGLSLLYLTIGVWSGGRILDRNWAKTISTMRTWPGHAI